MTPTSVPEYTWFVVRGYERTVPRTASFLLVSCQGNRPPRGANPIQQIQECVLDNTTGANSRYVPRIQMKACVCPLEVVAKNDFVNYRTYSIGTQVICIVSAVLEIFNLIPLFFLFCDFRITISSCLFTV